ncbi:MAG TPA: sigma-70 family RNA polymerase sigma factor [Ktedonobacterales bacterium]|jgi:RNA polymerase sigma-70 factor, ECF subfamily|nr:sigma-70 family RNA polymerase sigma factor [Ktedonobacterales bacterium]
MRLSTRSEPSASPHVDDVAEQQPALAREHKRVTSEGSSGSDWSFERIYDEYKTPIFNFIYHLVGNRELAEDLTQDTFFKACKALSRMDANLKVSAWLYSIAKNTAYDALRRRKLITWIQLPDHEHEPADVDRADPQQTIGTNELVRQTLEQMPKQYSLALQLYSQHGMTYAEIAKIVGIAESGVKMFLSRARHSFREHFHALDAGIPVTRHRHRR